MVATSTVLVALCIAIPLVVVTGIFIVNPLIHRDRSHAWRSSSAGRTDSLEATQVQILDEIRALRTQLDEVQRVLSAVE